VNERRHRPPWWVRAALPTAIAWLWLAALRNGIGGDFYYDEAVYANLAQHPFRSDFYDGAIFYGHPPFVQLFYWLVAAVAADLPREIVFRAASLVFASGGLVALWWALCHIVRADWLRVVVLGGVVASPLVVRYSLSATMYPFAFCFLALAMLGVATGKRWYRDAGFILLAYTHYFGDIVFACYLMALWLGGARWRELYAQARRVVLAILPIAVMTIMAAVAHLLRVRMHHLPQSYANLAFYVPVTLWVGIVCLIVAAARRGGFREADDVTRTMLLVVITFALLSAVSPPFERYVYFFFPVLALAGAAGIDRVLTARTPPAGAIGAILTSVLLLFPAPVLGAWEPLWFPNYYADNNRFGEWRATVTACGSVPVVTNNAKSYAYYLGERENRRLRTSTLADAGRLVQTGDAVGAAREIRAGCIVVDRHPHMRDWIDRIASELPMCHQIPVGTGVTRVYSCRWSGSGP
jgi:hypothetical protein